MTHTEIKIHLSLLNATLKMMEIRLKKFRNNLDQRGYLLDFEVDYILLCRDFKGKFWINN